MNPTIDSVLVVCAAGFAALLVGMFVASERRLHRIRRTVRWRGDAE